MVELTLMSDIASSRWKSNAFRSLCRCRSASVWTPRYRLAAYTHTHTNLNTHTQISTAHCRSHVTRQHILRLLPLLFVLGQLGLSCHCACRRSCVLLGLTKHWITDEDTQTYTHSHCLNTDTVWLVNSLLAVIKSGGELRVERVKKRKRKRGGGGGVWKPSVLLIEPFDWQLGRAVERTTSGWQKKERKRVRDRK